MNKMTTRRATEGERSRRKIDEREGEGERETK